LHAGVAGLRGSRRVRGAITEPSLPAVIEAIIESIQTGGAFACGPLMLPGRMGVESADEQSRNDESEQLNGAHA
jgi:hypothetical protein